MLFVGCGLLATSPTANADPIRLPGPTIYGTPIPCGPGQVEIVQDGEHGCLDWLDPFDRYVAGVDDLALGGGGGAPSGFNFPFTIPGPCGTVGAEVAVGAAFKAWQLDTHPGRSLIWFKANNKTYVFTFSDGKSQIYKWGLPLKESLPLQPQSGCF